MGAAPPTVVEVALNGMTTKEQNPHVPRTVDELVEDGLRCLDAGASVVHHHNEVAALCRAAGRPPATIDEAPKLLFGGH
jgi:uncharacterized protein (DUF849 family)